jgi:hypothetical protein
MVDTADLVLSESYFTVMQILRISAEWIQESIDDLCRMVEDMERLYLVSAANGQFPGFLPVGASESANSESAVNLDAAANAFRQNWESVIRQQKQLGNALLARIAKKEEETKSLRDGVSAYGPCAPTRSWRLTAYHVAFQRNGCQRGDKVHAAESLHLGLYRGDYFLPTPELYRGRCLGHI